ncbi:MAG TPA: GNAT family N-acetyltransferase [Thermotogota bacterium]|nr:GNAT family N-acetyltransferase [Thermotogota bacterium]HPJ89393.1 GNAT family N-acetyltransferase [Thermotogota bacterium]HPR96583.1 GNAT family N-acetyltransferase [Thermotogota bacterium]
MCDEIRKMKPEEMKDALKLVKNVFMEFEAPDYSEEGISAFQDFIEINEMEKRFNAGLLRFWVCKRDGEIAGVLASRNINHICLLFVHKAYHKRGIATRLFGEFKEDVLKSEADRFITVNSSPYAVGFYHQMGFKDMDSELEKDGIRFVPMKMML